MPSPDPMPLVCQLYSREQNSAIFGAKYIFFFYEILFENVVCDMSYIFTMRLRRSDGYRHCLNIVKFIRSCHDDRNFTIPDTGLVESQDKLRSTSRNCCACQPTTTAAQGKLYLAIDPVDNIVLDSMTSSNGNIFRVTGHLCGEFTGHRWIPHTKACNAGLWCFR